MTVRLPYDEMVTALRLLDEDLGDAYWDWFDEVMHQERGRATGETLEWSVKTNERYFR